MNKVIDIGEWKQAKAADREQRDYKDIEAQFAHYEDVLEALDMLPKYMIVRLVQYCLTHYISLSDIRRKYDS